MLVALMVMSVVTVGVAAWITIINGRTMYTEAVETGMLRRVAHENSKALAEEYMYQKIATEGSGAATTATLDSGASGKFVVPASTGNPFDSVVQPGGINRFGLSDGQGYAKYLDADLGDSTDTVSRSFQLRSRSPIFSGDLVTLHRPTLTVGTSSFRGNIRVNGRTVIWRPDYLNQGNSSNRFRSKEYTVMSSNYGGMTIKDLSGDRIRPSNYPFTPVTTGKTAGGSLGFDGQLSTVNNTTSTYNSMYHNLGATPIQATGSAVSSNRGVVSNGNGIISIDLNDPDLTNVLLTNDSYRVILNGQSNTSDFNDAGNRPAILIVILQDATSTRNLSQIRLTHENNRRVVVAIKKEIAAGDSLNLLRASFRFMDPDITPTWRLVAIGENTDMLFAQDGNGTVTMVGGVRCDRRFTYHNSSNKQLRIERETDPKLLERLVDRNVWLESYAN